MYAVCLSISTHYVRFSVTAVQGPLLVCSSLVRFVREDEITWVENENVWVRCWTLSISGYRYRMSIVEASVVILLGYLWDQKYKVLLVPHIVRMICSTSNPH